MAHDISQTPSVAHSAPPTWRPWDAHAPAPQLRAGPRVMAIASLSFLLIGFFFLALQIKAIFSDQLKQEYVGLVFEAIERAEAARSTVSEATQTRDLDDISAAAYQTARASLDNRLKTLAALVNASPFETSRIPHSAISPTASLDDTRMLLDFTAAYWRAQRDRTTTDMRTRLSRVADALIVLSAVLFGALMTALVMYSARNRQLVHESREFKQAALHDALTGLPNRRRLLDAIEVAAAKSAQAAQAAPDARPRKCAVLYIDLDGFKAINDTRGHRAGDELLVAVAKQFQQVVRVTDVVARIGGDEFAVLVQEFVNETQLAAIAQRLMKAVSDTADRLGVEFVTASIGIASYPDPIKDHDRLIAAADEAMYQVKRTGKSRYAFAAPSPGAAR